MFKLPAKKPLGKLHALFVRQAVFGLEEFVVCLLELVLALLQLAQLDVLRHGAVASGNLLPRLDRALQVGDAVLDARLCGFEHTL